MDSILSASEIEFYIDTMSPQTVQNVGSQQWIEWHQRLQKLNQEAMIQASLVKDEHVKETLVSFQKVPILVHEALVISIWKNKILPYLLKMDPNPDGSFLVYTILYHEVVCLSLLELVMFHANGSESLGDSAGDLLDYSYESASKLLSLEYMEVSLKEKGLEEIGRHKNNISFEIGVKALSVIRYLAEYLDRLTVSVCTQMYSTYDVPLLLIELLVRKPWLSKHKQYFAGKWVDWDGEAVPQAETQVWLGVRQLLLDQASLTHYPITDSRRSQILKLLPLMTPVLLDQISPLMELKEMVCRMSVSDQPTAPPKPILLEVVLEMKEAIVNQVRNRCKKIAKEQVGVIFTKDHERLVAVARSLSEAYNTDLIESFEETSGKACSKCGKMSVQKCSQCKIEWYCSRNCQVEDWPRHKPDCMESTSNN